VRLFIALPLPSEIAASAAALLPQVRGLRPVKPDLLHLTLAFIGRVPDEQLDDVVAATCEAAAGQMPFAATLATAGRFPLSGRPHVVWLGLTEGASESASLATAVRVALARHAIPFDGKPFRPHVTLARVKEDVDVREARDISSAVAKLTYAPLRYRVDAVLPIESVLSPKGPRYTARATVPLGVGR
jgi:2'-5' RNA ligase